MLEDVDTLEAEVNPDPEAIVRSLRGRGIRYVTFTDWKLIDAEERARGDAAGRPRSKIVRVDEMLRCCNR